MGRSHLKKFRTVARWFLHRCASDVEAARDRRCGLDSVAFHKASSALRPQLARSALICWFLHFDLRQRATIPAESRLVGSMARRRCRAGEAVIDPLTRSRSASAGANRPAARAGREIELAGAAARR
jgi:hypothetical protein